MRTRILLRARAGLGKPSRLPKSYWTMFWQCSRNGRDLPLTILKLTETTSEVSPDQSTWFQTKKGLNHRGFCTKPHALDHRAKREKSVRSWVQKVIDPMFLRWEKSITWRNGLITKACFQKTWSLMKPVCSTWPSQSQSCTTMKKSKHILEPRTQRPTRLCRMAPRTGSQLSKSRASKISSILRLRTQSAKPLLTISFWRETRVLMIRSASTMLMFNLQCLAKLQHIEIVMPAIGLFPRMIPPDQFLSTMKRLELSLQELIWVFNSSLVGGKTYGTKSRGEHSWSTTLRFTSMSSRKKRLRLLKSFTSLLSLNLSWNVFQAAWSINTGACFSWLTWSKKKRSWSTIQTALPWSWSSTATTRLWHILKKSRSFNESN